MPLDYMHADVHAAHIKERLVSHSECRRLTLKLKLQLTRFFGRGHEHLGTMHSFGS